MFSLSKCLLNIFSSISTNFFLRKMGNEKKSTEGAMSGIKYCTGNIPLNRKFYNNYEYKSVHIGNVRLVLFSKKLTFLIIPDLPKHTQQL